MHFLLLAKSHGYVIVINETTFSSNLVSGAEMEQSDDAPLAKVPGHLLSTLQEIGVCMYFYHVLIYG